MAMMAMRTLHENFSFAADADVDVADADVITMQNLDFCRAIGVKTTSYRSVP